MNTPAYRRRIQDWGIIALLACFLPVLVHAQVDSFTVVGTHPQAVNQSTDIGRVVATLMPWNGKIYMGYGDYGANTGPISVTSYNPETGEFTQEYVANTEAIYHYRPIGGRLYAPAIDRKGGGPGDYIMLDSTGIWQEFNCKPITTHGFDMASLGGDDLWMAGSLGYAACAWRSTDRGATWAVNRLDSVLSGNPAHFARYYFIAAFQGRIYVQARDSQGPLHPTSRVFDGIGWLTGPDLFPSTGSSFGWHPEEFKGELVYRTLHPPYRAAPFWAFDGNTARRPDSLYAWDSFIDSTYVWTLSLKWDSTLVVQRTPDLVAWETVTEAPPASRSIAVMDGYLYIGTKDSELLSYRLPLPSSVELPSAARGAELLAYPNPARSSVTVSIPDAAGAVRVHITDIRGRTVSETSTVNGSAIDVSGLPAGTYMVHYMLGNTRYTQKLIVR